MSGISAFADAPNMAGPQNGMSQSSMISVRSGQAVNNDNTIPDNTENTAEEPSLAVEQSSQTVAVGDASLYLSKTDDKNIAAQVGKTITSVDFSGIPEEVKTKISPLIQSKPVHRLQKKAFVMMSLFRIYRRVFSDYSSIHCCT